MDTTGQTALVTGASSGIGAVLARELAARGTHLVLVARSHDKLTDLATTLRAAHHVRVDVIAADLATDHGRDHVTTAVAGLGQHIDILVNNAGFAAHGDVATADPVALADQVRLNCLAVVDLTARFLPAMTAAGTGAIINIASTAAFQPLAHMAVYAASKSFVLSFTEALWAETRRSGVRVLAVCPGATDTPFFDVVGTDDAAVGTRRTPEHVVATALRAIDRDRPTVVDGRRNAAMAVLVRLLPHRLVIRMAERTVRPTPVAPPTQPN